jgi:DNA-binding NtrC family response regulator
MVPHSDTPRGAPSATAGSRILLVEDEFLIRMMIGDQLRDAGYDVIEAFNADEALAILKSPVRIDLIISDVRMPGSIDGLGLLAIVKTTLPTLPVIITSGHLEPRLAIADGATRFVAKPFSLEVIVEAVRAELGKNL